MPPRIGVYVCECGPNIKDALDTAGVVAAVRDIPEVVLAKSFHLLCAKQGTGLIKEDIATHSLDRIVVAGCSPKEHEKTFRDALEASDLNPSLLQIANIREQCAWVCKNKETATEKAISLTRAAVSRVIHHAPLIKEEIECQADVLVVGAGVAGISAALTLAQDHRKVYLVEKSPCIGGHAALYEDLFPELGCASCVLEPMLDQVLHHDQIEVLTLSEVTKVLGQWGNFSVQVRKKARYIDDLACIGCRACIDVCPSEAPNEFDQFLSKQKAVYIPYEGALPHIARIDNENCLHFQEKTCTACEDACPFGAIRFDQEDEQITLDVGAIILAVGFDLFSPETPSRYGIGTIENVCTALEFERILNSNGPTEGVIQLKNGAPPKRMAFIHCVGSRSQKNHSHCSAICCSYLLKFALMAREKIPDIAIEQFYTDFCLPGKAAQDLLTKAQKLPRFTPRRLQTPETISISKETEGIAVSYIDSENRQSTVMVDMVVLGPAMVGGTNTAQLANLLRIDQDKHRFFKEADPHLDPVSASVEGIFIAGCCQGPQDVPQSIAQGQATAGRILQQLVPGRKLPLPATAAAVDENLCSGCKTCLGLCEYGAIEYDDDQKQASVNTILCQGCGTCVAGCPSGAMTAGHFTDVAVMAETKSLLKK